MPTISKQSIEKIENRVKDLARRAALISSVVNEGNLQLLKKWKTFLEDAKENITILEERCRAVMQELGIEGVISELKKIAMNSDGSPKKLKEIIKTLSDDQKQIDIITDFIRLELANKNVDLQLKEANNKIEAIKENVFYLIEKNLEKIEKLITPNDLKILKGVGTKGKGVDERAISRVHQQEKIDELKKRFQSEPKKLALIISYEKHHKSILEEHDRIASLRALAVQNQAGKLTPKQKAFYAKLEKPIAYSDIVILDPIEPPSPTTPTATAKATAESPKPSTSAAAAKATSLTIQTEESAPPSPIPVNPVSISNPSTPTGSQTSTEPTTPEPVTPPPIVIKPHRSLEQRMADMENRMAKRMAATQAKYGETALEKAHWAQTKAELAKTTAATPEPDAEARKAEQAEKAKIEQLARKAELAAKLTGAFDQHKQTSAPLTPKPTTPPPEADKPPTPKNG